MNKKGQPEFESAVHDAERMYLYGLRSYVRFKAAGKPTDSIIKALRSYERLIGRDKAIAIRRKFQQERTKAWQRRKGSKRPHGT